MSRLISFFFYSLFSISGSDFIKLAYSTSLLAVHLHPLTFLAKCFIFETALLKRKWTDILLAIIASILIKTIAIKAKKD